MIYLICGVVFAGMTLALVFHKWVFSLVSGFISAAAGIISWALYPVNTLGWLLAWGLVLIGIICLWESYAINKRLMDEEEQRLMQLAHDRRVKWREDHNWGKRIDEEMYGIIRTKNEADANKMLNGGLAKRPIGAKRNNANKS